MSYASLVKQSEAEPEAWRYTSLSAHVGKLEASLPKKTSFDLPAAIAPVRLVFIDGTYRADLSVTAGLPEDFIWEDSNGLFLRVCPQTCLVLRPLELLFLTGAARESAPNIRLTLGANSRLTLIERHLHQGGSFCASMPEIKIVLEEQAKLVHGKIVSGGKTGIHIGALNARIAAGAFYDFFGLIKDGLLTREQTDLFLKGELAGTRLAGAALLRGAAQADRVARVFHEAPHGTSRQFFKYALDDKARGVFQGKIRVAAEAQKTDGHQLSRGLLLSDKAEMDATPELEIYADDVKCSHGSTVGDLSETEMFYLRSRGIDEKTARGLLVESFIADGIDGFQSAEFAALAREEVHAWLKA